MDPNFSNRLQPRLFFFFTSPDGGRVPNTNTPSTLILPSSNGSLFLLIYLPLHSFHLVPLTINEPPLSTTEPPCRGTTLLLAFFF